MTDKINIPDGPWIWRELGGKVMLVTRHGGAKVVLIATNDRIQTCNDDGLLRDLQSDSHLARAIEALPEIIQALRPRLNAETRDEVEALAEAYEACTPQGEARLASALRFLLERQDAARAVLERITGTPSSAHPCESRDPDHPREAGNPGGGA